MPAAVLDYETAPLAEAFHLAGSPSLTLAVSVTGPAAQLAARLLDVFPDGSTRYVTAGFFAQRYDEPGETPGPSIEVELNPVAWEFGAGHRIRLELSNLTVFDQTLLPQDPKEELWLLPFFDGFAVHVQHGVQPPAAASVLSLPRLVDLPDHVSLWASRYDASASLGALVELEFQTDPVHAGRPYRLLGSASGTTPGFDVDGVHVWLQQDAVYQTILQNPGFGPLSGFAGTVGPQGEGGGLIDLLQGLPPGFAGQEYSFAAVVFDGGTAVAASNPVTLTIRP